jgi:hypothetical protein
MRIGPGLRWPRADPDAPTIFPDTAGGTPARPAPAAFMPSMPVSAMIAMMTMLMSKRIRSTQRQPKSHDASSNLVHLAPPSQVKLHRQ